MMAAYPVRSKAVRQAANGEACTLEIVGVCKHDESTTVLAHLPDESHGISRKSDDMSAAFACFDCHEVIDGRRKWPDGEVGVSEWYMRRGMVRTWRRLIEMGLVTVKGVK